MHQLLLPLSRQAYDNRTLANDIALVRLASAAACAEPSSPSYEAAMLVKLDGDGGEASLLSSTSTAAASGYTGAAAGPKRRPPCQSGAHPRPKRPPHSAKVASAFGRSGVRPRPKWRQPLAKAASALGHSSAGSLRKHLPAMPSRPGVQPRPLSSPGRSAASERRHAAHS